MSVIVGVATRGAAAIAGDGIHYHLVDGQLVRGADIVKVARAGAHAVGVAGVIAHDGTNFLDALVSGLLRCSEPGKALDAFLISCGKQFADAFAEWRHMPVFSGESPRRFFEAVLAWRGACAFELWSLVANVRDDKLTVSMTSPRPSSAEATVVIAGSRDDELDLYATENRHLRLVLAMEDRVPRTVPSTSTSLPELGAWVRALVERQVARGVSPRPSGWPSHLPAVGGATTVVTIPW